MMTKETNEYGKTEHIRARHEHLPCHKQA